ncbi:SRPBCC domain-containing protein (plasmid) [Phyllobacteriaceae bacterium JZ32]
MVDILHRVGINAPPRDVYNALTTLDRLSDWWTNDTRGHTEIGGVIKFTFGERGFFDMKVLGLEPEKRVVWEVVDGPKEWIGTKVIWDLKPFGEGTTILFKQQGWREPVEFMHHCSTKWATFLMSLKALLETGKGSPYPNDVLISIDFD